MDSIKQQRKPWKKLQKSLLNVILTQMKQQKMSGFSGAYNIHVKQSYQER